MAHAAALGKFLECPSCKVPITTAADSCMLPCLDYFCRNCLLDSVKNSGVLCCPDCDRHVRIPVDQLPPYPKLVQLMEFMAEIQLRSKEPKTPKEQHQEDLAHLEWINRMNQPLPEGFEFEPLQEGYVHDVDLADLNGFDLMWNEDDLVTYDEDVLHANDDDPYVMDFVMYDGDAFDLYVEEPADGA